VPATQDGRRNRPNPDNRRSLKTPIWENDRRQPAAVPERGKMQAKSLALKDFTSESFKLKDLAEIFS
jgi:hypothetical protein